MKSIFLVGILVLTLSCSVSNVAQKPTEEGLISFYKFDGNANDSRGSNHGASTRMRYSAFDKRNTQGIADFDGSRSYIDLPSAFDFKNRTISFWFRAKEIPSAGAIMFASDNPALQYGLTAFSLKDEGDLNLYFNFSGGIFATRIERGKWYHVGASLQEKNYRYYLNGKQVAAGSFGEYIKSGNGRPSAIIGSSRAHDRIFTGSIDDLRIYNRALSEAEIGVLATP